MCVVDNIPILFPFSQCWCNVGSPSATMAQHYTNIGWASYAYRIASFVCVTEVVVQWLTLPAIGKSEIVGTLTFKFQRNKMCLPAHSQWSNIVGNLCDREVACSALVLQGSIFESCVWRAVPSHSSHNPQEVPPA